MSIPECCFAEHSLLPGILNKAIEGITSSVAGSGQLVSSAEFWETPSPNRGNDQRADSAENYRRNRSEPTRR